MPNPILFFSHSTRDKHSLVRLKDLFTAKTGGSIEVFLSSDGQSLPFGRNWVHKIEEALNQAQAMIVFITPNSYKSSWVYFESGFCYAKKIKVIPVGFLGIDIGEIAPPLNLLQGFNIKSEEGLNNLIAISNDTFGHRHNTNFSKKEYSDIIGSSGLGAQQIFGDYTGLIEDVRIHLSSNNILSVSPVDALGSMQGYLREIGVPHQVGERTISMFGVNITAPAGVTPEPLDFSIDPFIADQVLPLIHQLLGRFIPGGSLGLEIRFDFNSDVGIIKGSHKISGRLLGTGAELAKNGHIRWKEIEFDINHLLNFAGGRAKLGSVYINTKMLNNVIPLDQIGELIQVLFDRGVLFIGSESE